MPESAVMPAKDETFASQPATPAKNDAPVKVLITGGHEVGGLTSFAEALAEGFQQLGIPSEIIRPTRIWSRWREMRDPRVLKILSTTAVFAAPFVRRAICGAHGCPCADVQGWAKVFGFLGSYKLANICRGTKLVAVSEYSAIHLVEIFNLRFDAVIQNPAKAVFLSAPAQEEEQRNLITYVGRLHPSKNLHRLLPAICDLLNEHAELQAYIVGEGPQSAALRKMAAGEPRVVFTGPLNSASVRDVLRRTKVFVSGNQTEPFGITYLEALSQGCTVAMPASGGGIEIAPELIGRQIYLLPISLNRALVQSVLDRALNGRPEVLDLSAYTVERVSRSYLEVDAAIARSGSWDSRRVQSVSR